MESATTTKMRPEASLDARKAPPTRAAAEKLSVSLLLREAAPGATSKLVAFAVGTGFADLPPAVVLRLRCLLLGIAAFAAGHV